MALVEQELEPSMPWVPFATASCSGCWSSPHSFATTVGLPKKTLRRRPAGELLLLPSRHDVAGGWPTVCSGAEKSTS